MYVVKMRGGYLCANGGPTKHLKFSTKFDTKRKAKEVAQKWLRSDIEYMLSEIERKRG